MKNDIHRALSKQLIPEQSARVRIAGIIYPMSPRSPLVIIFIVGLAIIFMSACNRTSPIETGTMVVATTTETAVVSPEPSRTPVPPTPTSTPIPLAAVVNGEPITLAEFQAELARFQAATTISGTNIASDTNTMVLNELIDQTLFAQAATESGFVVDDSLLQSRIESLDDQLGDVQALEDWKIAHGYTDDDFQKALQRSISMAWMRDQIISGVPEAADQVHVKQILLYTATEANEVYASLQSGTDFLELAAEYDPVTEGDLGWFTRGYLGDTAIEEAAFALQPGQYSQVIETEIGYHILYLVERDPNRPLQSEARRALQLIALKNWIRERRDQSEIQILLP